MLNRILMLVAVAAILSAAFLRSHWPTHWRRTPAVSTKDVVGAWRYSPVPPEDGDTGWNVTIEFAKDGSFRQTLVPPRARSLIVQTGKWRIEGAALILAPVVVWDETAAGHWTRRAQTWPVVESTKRSGALGICGGLAADQSLDREFDKISDAECMLLTSGTGTER